MIPPRGTGKNERQQSVSTESQFPAFFPFKGGEIKCAPADFQQSKCTVWTIRKGAFQCTSRDCRKLHKPGDGVVPVFWKRKPTNFVCGHCRGILEPQNRPD
jgi:hypothetical protein